MKKEFVILIIALVFVLVVSNSDRMKTKKIKKGNMKIKIVRDTFTDKSTIGKLYIDGKYFCDTLEDKVREKKEKGITAIPKGVYDTVLNYSNRFKKIMPQLLNVPNFEGIRIHNGNTAENTDGCILLGKRQGKDFVGNSKKAYSSFMEIVNLFYKQNPNGKIETEIL